MKKAIFGFVLFVLVVVAYLFWPDFSLVKNLFNSSVSEIKELFFTKPDIDDDDRGLGFLNVPEGFKVSVAADNLDGPRVIVFDKENKMLVSETKAGRVRILEDKDKDGDYESKRTLIDNLRLPHGLDFYTSGKTVYLYIAETHQVARYPYDIEAGELTKKTGENIATLPPDGSHFTRTIMFGPNWRDIDLVKGSFSIGGFYSDIKLYISVGSSCDVCLESTWKRAAILESDPEGSFTGEFAGGLRNSVFLTLHPETREIWATDTGRDNLGDDLPPDEINIVKVAGPEHKFGARRFGWPFCYGNKIKDKTFNPENVERIDIPQECNQTDAPVVELPAHSAPLGLAFINSDKWPSQWKNDLLVALHGSWNRSEKVGYKLIRVKIDKKGRLSEVSDFITGWLNQDKQKVFGRPVDLKFGPDGSLYISDDAVGIIYRVEPK